MNGLNFADPLWLLAGIPVLVVLFWQGRRRGRQAITYSHVGELRDLPVTLVQRLRKLTPWLQGIGLLALVTALARPQRGEEEYRVRTEGVAILMCLDQSGSMEAMDFERDGERATRLEVCKDAFHAFVAGDEEGLGGRPDDLIGLVAFGGFARSLCPLTLDHGVLLDILDSVEVPKPLVDERGRILDEEFSQLEQATAIGDALARGVSRLKDHEAKSRILILLSDGENTYGVIDPMEAANAAKELGIKVYTIGVGSTGRAPFRMTDRLGNERLVAQQVSLDETLLRGIAESTGGEYFNVRDVATLRKVYSIIDEAEKTETETLRYTRYRELYLYVILPGLGLLLLDLLLRCTRLVVVP